MFIFGNYPSELNSTSVAQVNKSQNELTPRLIAFNNTAFLENATSTFNLICRDKGNASSVVIITDKHKYLLDEFVRLHVSAADEKGCPVDAKVTVKAIELDPVNSSHNKIVFQETAFTEGIFFNRSGFISSKTGLYNITGSLNASENNTRDSFVIIKIIPWYEQNFVPLLTVSLISFLAIIIISSIEKIRIRPISETLRFLFISFFVMSVIAVFLFIGDEIGTYGPFGLVLTLGDTSQWVINVGGVFINNYKYGITIPFYVFLFGIAGGYLRYLYKTSKMNLPSEPIDEKEMLKWNDIPGEDSVKMRNLLRERLDLYWITNQEFVKNDRTISITDGKQVLIINLNNTGTRAIVKVDNITTSYQFGVLKKNDLLYLYPLTTEKRGIFYRSLEDIALILLSPLLAIATWLLLKQGGVNIDSGAFMLAAVSFAVGLVTDDVIKALIGFVSSKLGTSDEKRKSAA